MCTHILESVHMAVGGPYSIHSDMILCPGFTGAAYNLLPAASQNQWQAEIHSGCTQIYKD